MTVGVRDGCPPHPRPFAESILNEAEGLRVTNVKLFMTIYIDSLTHVVPTSHTLESSITQDGYKPTQSCIAPVL